MQVHSLLRGEVRVALCGLLERVERCELGRAAAGFGFGFEGVLLGLAPGAEAREAQAHLLRLRFEVGEGMLLAGAERGEVVAVVRLAEAVLEAVLAVAVVAAGARVLEGVDDGFAVDFGAGGWCQAGQGGG